MKLRLLQEGVFSIESMTVVMQSGLLLDLPGNARISPYNLNIPGTVMVNVYCHVVRDDSKGEADSDGWKEESEDTIPRVSYLVELSSDQNYPEAFQTMKIASFEKDPEGIKTPIQFLTEKMSTVEFKNDQVKNRQKYSDDEEGIETFKNLGKNFAYVLKKLKS